MNYIKQIRFLWAKAKRHSLGANEISMYFYLLEVSNLNQWENPVMEPNATLQNAIRVKSFNTLKEARNRLQQFGLIRFRSKNGSSIVEYDFYDVERETFAKFEEVAAKVTDEVDDEVPEKVRAEVIENTIVLYKPKPKPKLLIKGSGDDPVKSFNLRGHLIKRNAGEVLLEKFEARLEQEFMKEFKSLNIDEMLSKFTEKSFLMSFSDENHMFNSFKKMCKDELINNSKPGSQGNSQSLKKTWGG